MTIQMFPGSPSVARTVSRDEGERLQVTLQGWVALWSLFKIPHFSQLIKDFSVAKKSRTHRSVAQRVPIRRHIQGSEDRSITQKDNPGKSYRGPHLALESMAVLTREKGTSHLQPHGHRSAGFTQSYSACSVSNTRNWPRRRRKTAGCRDAGRSLDSSTKLLTRI